MAESMMDDKLVVAMAWSGNTDFMPPPNGFPEEPILAGQTWGDPSVEDVPELTRLVFDDREVAVPGDPVRERG